MEENSVLLNTNGIRLHAVTAGPDDGPLALLLHGFPEFSYSWRRQIEPLAAAGFHVVAPDLRGYNRSDKPRGIDAYRLDRIATDIAGLVQTLGRKSAMLVGHDWGGVAAWTTAALFPESVSRLAVLNAPYPTVGLRAILHDSSQFLRSAYIYFLQIPAIPEAILRNNNWEPLAESMRRSSRPGTFRDQDFNTYRNAWWKAGAMTSMLNWYRAFVQRPAPIPWKPRIQTPTLILWGRHDFALSRVNAQLSLDLCVDGRLEYTDAGHWLQHEEPDWVNEKLLEFLKS